MLAHKEAFGEMSILSCDKVQSEMCSNAAVLVALCDCLSCTIAATSRWECVVENVVEGLQDQGRRLG
jgi:hypothetical protein